MTNKVRIFLSPSDQDNNKGDLDKHEQYYAQQRCLATSLVLNAAGVTNRISEAGIGDDSWGWAASRDEANAWGATHVIADHTNATGVPGVKRRGVDMYVYPGDPESRRLAQCIINRVRPIFGDVPTSIRDGSHLGEVNGTNGHAVLMELGYHDNPIDARIIETRSVELGTAVGHAVLDYLGLAAPMTAASSIIKEELMDIKALADGLRDQMEIWTTPKHKASLGQHVADGINRIIKVDDRTSGMVETLDKISETLTRIEKRLEA